MMTFLWRETRFGAEVAARFFSTAISQAGSTTARDQARQTAGRKGVPCLAIPLPSSRGEDRLVAFKRQKPPK